jgi:hypothetical protein
MRHCNTKDGRGDGVLLDAVFIGGPKDGDATKLLVEEGWESLRFIAPDSADPGVRHLYGGFQKKNGQAVRMEYLGAEAKT